MRLRSRIWSTTLSGMGLWNYRGDSGAFFSADDTPRRGGGADPALIFVFIVLFPQDIGDRRQKVKVVANRCSNCIMRPFRCSSSEVLIGSFGFVAAHTQRSYFHIASRPVGVWLLTEGERKVTCIAMVKRAAFRCYVYRVENLISKTILNHLI